LLQINAASFARLTASGTAGPAPLPRSPGAGIIVSGNAVFASALSCPMTDAMLDCLIIGGGPAGLTAAIYCSRFLLSTVVIDAGNGRASRIPKTHNHAGFPGGISGEALLDRFRRQAVENGASIESGLVETLIKTGDMFEALVGKSTVRARTILLATGISDRPPPMDQHLHDEALGSGLIRYCPICDGYEIVDRKVGVIGTGEHGAREAAFLRSFSRRVTLIAPDGGHDLSMESMAELASIGVRIIDGPVSNFTNAGSRLRMDTPSGQHDFDAIYPALGADIHSDLAVALGADAREGGCLIVDDHARTSVPGLYAAGDVVLGLDQISGAMGQAALAATTIRNDLGKRGRRLR
jgi:thioredoxin reductase (NADPH)